MPRRLMTILSALAIAALLLSACGGKEYVHEQHGDRQYKVERYNCEWEITHENPDIDGDELDRRVEQCLKELGWTEKQPEPEKEDDGWWPW